MSFSSKKLSWLLVALMLLVVGLIRCRLADIPLERDEGEYAYGGQLVLEGKLPTQYVYSMKLPGIYYAYAALLAISDQTPEGIHTGLLVINLLTTIAVFMLARRLISPMGAAVSAISFAFFSLCSTVHGVMANAEHFIIFFAVFGLWVLACAISSGRTYEFFLSGLLLGAGCTMKQHGVAFCLFAVLYLIYEIVRRKSFSSPIPRSCPGWFICGMLMVPMILAFLIIQAGQFGVFWFWTVTCSRVYISEISVQQAVRNFWMYFGPIVQSAWFWWILAGFGVLMLFAKKNASRNIFLGLYGIFSILAVCPGFYFRPHYFILLLPAVSLLAGLAASRIFDFMTKICPPWFQYGGVILLVGIGSAQCIYRQFDFLFQMTPYQASQLMYYPTPFTESADVANYIRRQTSPDDTVGIIGSEPQILFYAQRHSATPYIYLYPLMDARASADQMQKEFIRDIETRRPGYIVFVGTDSWEYSGSSPPLLLTWFDDYRKRHLRLVGISRFFGQPMIYQDWDIATPLPRSGLLLFEQVE